MGLSLLLSGKESIFSAGDAGSVPGWGISPGEGHGSPLQYYFLESPNSFVVNHLEVP